MLLVGTYVNSIDKSNNNNDEYKEGLWEFVSETDDGRDVIDRTVVPGGYIYRTIKKRNLNTSVGTVFVPNSSLMNNKTKREDQ